MFQSRRVTRSTGSMISGLSGRRRARDRRRHNTDDDRGIVHDSVQRPLTSSDGVPGSIRQLTVALARLRQRVFRVPSRQLRRDAGGAQLGVIQRTRVGKAPDRRGVGRGLGDGGHVRRQLALLELPPPRERRARDLVQLCRKFVRAQAAQRRRSR